MDVRFKQYSVLPAFGITLGCTMLYLSLIVLLPLAALALKASTSFDSFWSTVAAPRVVASYRLTITTSLMAAIVNLVFGFVVAWSLVRYRFPGRRLIDAMVDLPIAIPTAVSGIALTALYSKHGWIGKHLYELGIQSAYSPLGITLALTFIGVPFVVRTIQPALEELDREMEEAAASLGANRFQTFSRVILPSILPSLLTGFSLAFARGLGEYGSVVFISGNMPMKTEITSLLITTKLDQHDTVGATMIAVVMLGLSFVTLLMINLLQWWLHHRQSAGGR